ncbi:hypothetical protein NL676_037211 [Syzygium grande]|nr:hypothetical protein NL676_037211 [Syzygium grande]
MPGLAMATGPAAQVQHGPGPFEEGGRANFFGLDQAQIYGSSGPIKTPSLTREHNYGQSSRLVQGKRDGCRQLGGFKGTVRFEAVSKAAEKYREMAKSDDRVISTSAPVGCKAPTEVASESPDLPPSLLPSLGRDRVLRTTGQGKSSLHFWDW